MKTLRFALLFCALALPFSALPAFAQNVTGSLSTILDEEPSGSGWSSVVSDAQAQCIGNGHPYFWATIGEVGYMTIAWGPSPADPGETPGKTVSQQATSITNYLEAPKGLVSGNIVLLHNGRKHTVLALQQVLPYLQKNGWSLGKVSDVQPIPADPNVSASNP